MHIIQKVYNKLSSLLYSYFPITRIIFEFFKYFFYLFPKFAILSFFKKKTERVATNRYVTYTPTGEGIGGLIVRYTAAKTIANMFNLKYVHTPYPECFHYTADFDSFLGYGVGELKKDDINESELSIIHVPEFNLKNFPKIKWLFLLLFFNHNHTSSNTLFILSGFSNVELYRNDPGYNKILLNELYTKYWKMREITPVGIPYAEGKIKVGVHLRRGEITTLKKSRTKQGLARWRNNDWYISVIIKINETYGPENVDIHIYTDTETPEELQDYSRITNITFHIKKNEEDQPLKAFHAMVVSDIAICSLSGFSIESARLSNGIKILPTSNMGYERIFLEPKWMHVNSGIDCDFRSTVNRPPSK